MTTPRLCPGCDFLDGEHTLGCTLAVLFEPDEQETLGELTAALDLFLTEAARLGPREASVVGVSLGDAALPPHEVARSGHRVLIIDSLSRHAPLGDVRGVLDRARRHQAAPIVALLGHLDAAFEPVRSTESILRLRPPYTLERPRVRPLAPGEWNCVCGCRPNPPERVRCRGCGEPR